MLSPDRVCCGGGGALVGVGALGGREALACAVEKSSLESMCCRGTELSYSIDWGIIGGGGGAVACSPGK